MRLTFLIVFLFFFITTASEHPAPIVVRQQNHESVDLFTPAFELIMKAEGYYVNHPRDKGRETYAGITRKYNADWKGWKVIEDYKKKHGKPKWNQKFPELDSLVKLHYHSFWKRENFEKIEDETLRMFVFDFRIHSYLSINLIQDFLKVPVTGKLDSITVESINTQNPEYLLEKFKIVRLSHYDRIVARDSTQAIFMSNWKKRVLKFQYVNNNNKAGDKGNPI